MSNVYFLIILLRFYLPLFILNLIREEKLVEKMALSMSCNFQKEGSTESVCHWLCLRGREPMGNFIHSEFVLQQS